MSPAIIFTKQGVEIMALKSKTETEETNVTEQINFDDLIASTDAVYSDGGEKPVYYTITGKEQDYNPLWDIYKNYEADVGDWLEGKPEVTIIPKEDKNYDALRIRIIDETTDEVLDCYANFPRADKNGFVKGLNRDFDFYRNAFDFIYSVLKTRGEKYVLDKNGEEYDRFNRVDFLGFAKLVDQMKKVRIEITEGNEDSDYNSWMITNME
jgi:hypothetical protein